MTISQFQRLSGSWVHRYIDIYVCMCEYRSMYIYMYTFYFKFLGFQNLIPEYLKISCGQGWTLLPAAATAGSGCPAIPPGELPGCHGTCPKGMHFWKPADKNAVTLSSHTKWFEGMMGLLYIWIDLSGVCERDLFWSPVSSEHFMLLPLSLHSNPAIFFNSPATCMAD